MVVMILPAARYTVMLLPYGGFTTSIVAVIMMNGPKEVWESEARTAEQDLAQDHVPHGGLPCSGVRNEGVRH